MVIRWWSKFEVIEQVLDLIFNTPDLPEVTRRKLTDICGQPQQQALLKIELAVTVDAIEPFVKATYNLKGDGPLELRAYQELRTVESSIANDYYPNIIAVSCLLSQGNVPVQQQWINHATECIQLRELAAYQALTDDVAGEINVLE